jgi:hypothetical protein
MNLNDTPAIAAALGGRQPGHLIQAADWNSVAEMLALFGTTLIDLGGRVTALEADVATLNTAVAALETVPERLATLEDNVGPLLENYLVKISTAAPNHLVGEVAEITISVLALDGSLITGDLPWVDVFATWGRLRAAPGFNVRANAQENALSVQVNAQGIARVQLRADATRGFEASDEQQFSNLLQTQVGNKTMRQIFSEAPSPQDQTVKGAFAQIHTAYHGNQTTQRYLDGYVGQYTGGRVTLDRLPRLGTWEDHRTTVMAFAKPDADPRSPDPARGVASIQIEFREWISHWAGDFFGELADVTPQFDLVLEQQFEREEIVIGAIRELDLINKKTGPLGHIRHTLGMQVALSKINPGGDLVRQQAKDLIDGAMKAQLAAGAGGGTDMALGYAAQAQASNEASRQAQAASAQATQAQAMKAAVDVLEGRMKAAEETGRTITDSLTRIGDGVNKINVVEVADLGTRLQKINADISLLAGKINS